MKPLKRYLWFVLDQIDTGINEITYISRPIELAQTEWQIRDCLAKQVNREKPTT